MRKVTFDLERNSETIIEVDESGYREEEDIQAPPQEIDIEEKIKEIQQYQEERARSENNSKILAKRLS